MTPQELLNKYPIISDQIDAKELIIILNKLSEVNSQQVSGDVVEFGCYVGTTSLFIQRMIAGTGRTLHVYDSFAGLPEKTKPDISPIGYNFVEGALNAQKQQFIKNFKKAGLPLPHIHKGWFKDFTVADIPSKIAFAFLDGDYYQSVRDSLRLIEPALVPGAVIVIDDYMNESLPGAKIAVDEWLTSHRNYKLQPISSLAVLNNYS